jgi:hypothetical protein
MSSVYHCCVLTRVTVFVNLFTWSAVKVMWLSMVIIQHHCVWDVCSFNPHCEPAVLTSFLIMFKKVGRVVKHN